MVSFANAELSDVQVLIVEDDEVFAISQVASVFKDEWDTYVTYNVTETMTVLQGIDDLKLAIVDLHLPDGAKDATTHGGAGFEVIEEVRRRFPLAHVAVLTGNLTPGLVNRTQLLSAEFISKKGCKKNMETLVKRLRIPPDDMSRETAQALARRYGQSIGLTPKQQEVLDLFIKGLSRGDVEETLNISYWTLKSHISAILQKAGKRRMSGLVSRIHREARSR